MSVFTRAIPLGQSERVSHQAYLSQTSSFQPQNIPHQPVTSTIKIKNAIAIAISGCSSSGKTTLAILLAEIFSTAGNIPKILSSDKVVDTKEFMKETENKNDEKVPAVAENGRPIIIHQDSYFMDKSYCPSITFDSTPADVDFIKATLTNDTIRIYTVVLGEDFETTGYVNDCAGGVYHSSTTGYVWREQSTIERISHLTDSGSAANTSPIHPYWRITGPDADCWTAVDITSLLEEIQHVHENGTLSFDSHRHDETVAHYTTVPIATAAQRATILSEHAVLIARIKTVVEAWIREPVLTHAGSREGGPNTRSAIEARTANPFLCPRLCFIEGFLLFPEPTSAHDQGSSSINKEPASLTPLLSRSISQTSSHNDRRGSWYTTQTKAAAHQARNTKAIPELMSKFDIKLFLPTSRDVAKARRCARECYVDAPDGQRYPGQLWKSEGYFNNVAWGNYVKKHTWISAEDLDFSQLVNGSVKAKEAGVHVRPGIDPGIEDTVEWSVAVILRELDKFVRVEASGLEVCRKSHRRSEDSVVGWPK